MSAQSHLSQQERQVYGDGVVSVGYALLLMVAVVFFIGACYSLKAYLPDLEQQGLTKAVLKETPAMLLFAVSMLLAVPVTVLLLCRCIWSSKEVSFFTWSVVLVGGVLSFVYIVFWLNLITRNMAQWLDTVLY